VNILLPRPCAATAHDTLEGEYLPACQAYPPQHRRQAYSVNTGQRPSRLRMVRLSGNSLAAAACDPRNRRCAWTAVPTDPCNAWRGTIRALREAV